MDSIKEFRVSLTVDDFEKTVAFYQEVLGLPIKNDWTTPQGRCIVLSIEKATIEIIDHAQANLIDEVEIGQRIAGQVRFAFQFSDVRASVAKAHLGGAHVLHDPVKHLGKI